MDALVMNVPNIELSDEQLFELCRANDSLRLERNSSGQLIIMSPTGGKPGNRNSELLIELGLWNRASRLGYLFDSSTGFSLSNGAMYAPDVSWVARERWEGLSEEEKEKF